MFVRPLLLLFALGVLSPSGAAQVGSANHTVTVRVSQISILRLNGGSVAMSITGAGMLAGRDTMSVTNQATSLSWGTNLNAIKTTVSTNLAAPRFTLKVLAVGNTGGLAASERTLSTVPGDFLLNLGRTSGTANIRYTGIATAVQGTGLDNHIITFTLQSQ